MRVACLALWKISNLCRQPYSISFFSSWYLGYVGEDRMSWLLPSAAICVHIVGGAPAPAPQHNTRMTPLDAIYMLTIR
jgi:hypothetical protein